MALFNEPFTGANDTLVSGLTGWSVSGSTGTNVAKLDGTGALKTTDTTNDAALVYHVVGGADMYVDFVLGANFGSGSGALPLVVARCGTSRGSGGYGVTWTGTAWRIYNTNTFAVVATGSADNTGGGPAAGDTVRLKCVGTTITVERPAGTVKLTVTDGTFSGSNMGLQLRTNGGPFTDLIRDLTTDVVNSYSAIERQTRAAGIGRGIGRGMRRVVTELNPRRLFPVFLPPILGVR